MKKKILIPINNDIFVRNYLTTSSLKLLKKKFNVVLCAKRNEVTIKKFFNKKNFGGYYNFTKKEKKYYDYFWLKNLVKEKNKSNTVKISLKVVLNFYFFLNKFKSKFFYFPVILSLYAIRFFKILSYFIYYNLLKKKIIYNKKINPRIKFLIKKHKPDLILIPTQAHDIAYHEFIIESKKQKIKTCAIIDNWDNLSSRVHANPKADHYIVWGKQSEVFANNYQNINQKKISIIGTSRYDNYFITRKQKLKSHFNFDYILFAEGFGIQEDLNLFFTIIDAELEKIKKLISLKLVYRPHPWRKDQKNIDIKKFKNIVLDPQMKYYYENKLSNTSIQPDLNYYPSLMKNASFIIAAPSTMVIESTIFWKPIILLAHDHSSKLGNFSYLKNIEHFKNIEKLPNVILCKKLNDLNSLFLKALKLNTSKKRKLDKLRNYYLYNDNKRYYSRLEKIISNLI